MRTIGTLPHENLARQFSRFLASRSIANTVEVHFDPATAELSYQIWIHEEDKIEKAEAFLQSFLKSPSDPTFEVPVIEEVAEETEPPPPPKQFKSYITHFFLGLCCLVFFLNFLEQLSIPPDTKALTSIQEELMFDVPASPSAPYWHGAYDWMVAKIKQENTSSVEGPLFTQIRQGQVWRLFTPCILHIDLLHILFNMLWLWYLGRPIEQRIGSLRTLSLTLIAGVVPNVIQYLMSGPFFIGYSGIVTALAGFIWMREKIAPWEGYPLNKATLLFLLFFIGAIFLLQCVAFGIQIFTSYNFAPNIANTAHIVGAIVGAILARFSFFAQKVHK